MGASRNSGIRAGKSRRVSVSHHALSAAARVRGIWWQIRGQIHWNARALKAARLLSPCQRTNGPCYKLIVASNRSNEPLSNVIHDRTRSTGPARRSKSDPGTGAESRRIMPFNSNVI